jgi:hypothetical protein
VRASEKRIRLELERELRDKVRMMVKLSDGGTTTSTKDTGFREEMMLDLESKVVEYKRLRDVLAAELKLVELAVVELEGAVFTTTPTTGRPPPPPPRQNSGDEHRGGGGGAGEDDMYARLMRCVRTIKQQQHHEHPVTS